MTARARPRRHSGRPYAKAVLGDRVYSGYRAGTGRLPVPGKAVVLHDGRVVLTLDVVFRLLESAARPQDVPGG